MIQLQFAEIRVSALADVPVLVLREHNGDRQLPIWISAAAGAAILSALEPDDAAHPRTHDLLIDALASCEASIDALHILSVAEGLFDAQVLVNGRPLTCRVSDGVALALRCGAPILMADEVFQANCIDPERVSASDALLEDDDAVEVKQFREFLQNVRAEDFEGPHD